MTKPADRDQEASSGDRSRELKLRRRRGRTFSEGRRVELRVESFEDRNMITESLGMVAGWGINLSAGIVAAELAQRRAAWKAPAPRYTRGVQAKFAFNASSASKGAVLDNFS